MPRPSPYVGWRRWASQAVMWAILAGVVALAGVVDARIEASRRIRLGPARVRGDVSVRLPAGWRASDDEVQAAGVVAAAREPVTGGREITVYRERVGTLISPLEYLYESPLVDAGVRAEPQGAAVPAEKPTASPMKVGKYNGLLLAVMTIEGSDGEPRKTLSACAVLPGREAVTVKLEGPGMIDRSDFLLIEHVAGSVTVRGEPGLGTAGGEVTFDDGTTLTAPQGMRPVEERDALVATRYMMDDASATAWSAAEVTPCIFDRHDGVEGALWLFVVHDARWLTAKAQELGPGRYRVELSPAAQGPVPVVGYLTADEKGHALLAVLRGMGRNEAEFDGIWAGIEKTVHFAAVDYPARARAGVAAAERMRRAGLSELLGADRAERWWRWSDAGAGRTLGWTHFRFEDPGKLLADRETRWRAGGEEVVSVSHRWLTQENLRDELSSVTRQVSVDEPQARPKQVLHQEVRTTGGHISVDLALRGQSLGTRSFGQMPNFFPGGWLPRLVSRLADRAMVVQTDAVWGPPDAGAGAEGDLGTACQFVTIMPENAATTSATNASAAGPAPGVYLIEVNGTGKRSRWTIGADGTVDRVEFAAGLRAERVDLAALRTSFGDDPRMAP